MPNWERVLSNYCIHFIHKNSVCHLECKVKCAICIWWIHESHRIELMSVSLFSIFTFSIFFPCVCIHLIRLFAVEMWSGWCPHIFTRAHFLTRTKNKVACFFVRVFMLIYSIYDFLFSNVDTWFLRFRPINRSQVVNQRTCLLSFV